MKGSMMPSTSVRKVLIPILLGLLVYAFVVSPAMARASSASKVQMWDNTQTGWQNAGPVIGFVVFNQDANGRLIITVSLKGAVPNAVLEIQLVTSGTTPDGGITQTGHYGYINVLGTISTNGQGNGNAHFNVDVTTLGGTVSGVSNYGHINPEDDSGALTPGILDYGLVNNQYGSMPLQWMQP